MKRLLAKFWAWRQARRIMRSLKEAKEIHAGERPAKSLDDFLKEL